MSERFTAFEPRREPHRRSVALARRSRCGCFDVRRKRIAPSGQCVVCLKHALGWRDGHAHHLQTRDTVIVLKIVEDP